MELVLYYQYEPNHLRICITDGFQCRRQPIQFGTFRTRTGTLPLRNHLRICITGGFQRRQPVPYHYEITYEYVSRVDFNVTNQSNLDLEPFGPVPPMASLRDLIQPIGNPERPSWKSFFFK